MQNLRLLVTIALIASSASASSETGSAEQYNNMHDQASDIYGNIIFNLDNAIFYGIQYMHDPTSDILGKTQKKRSWGNQSCSMSPPPQRPQQYQHRRSNLFFCTLSFQMFDFSPLCLSKKFSFLYCVFSNDASSGLLPCSLNGNNKCSRPHALFQKVLHTNTLTSTSISHQHQSHITDQHSHIEFLHSHNVPRKVSALFPLSPLSQAQEGNLGRGNSYRSHTSE